MLHGRLLKAIHKRFFGLCIRLYHEHGFKHRNIRASSGIFYN